jgi:hypothetical protein
MVLYKNNQSAVRTSSGMSDWFKVTSCVRQGCVLSPLLFIKYIDRISKETNIEISNEKSTSERISSNINELLFADDQCLVYDDTHQLQKHANALHKSCNNKYDMKINFKKN